MPLLYHAATPADWSHALNKGSYAPGAFATEGFIHLSTRSQLQQSIELHFADQQSLYILVMSERLLKNHLKWEHSAKRGEDFPHYYARLQLDVVEDVAQLDRLPSGEWDWEGLPQ